MMRFEMVFVSGLIILLIGALIILSTNKERIIKTDILLAIGITLVMLAGYMRGVQYTLSQCR